MLLRCMNAGGTSRGRYNVDGIVTNHFSLTSFLSKGDCDKKRRNKKTKHKMVLLRLWRSRDDTAVEIACDVALLSFVMLLCFRLRCCFCCFCWHCFKLRLPTLVMLMMLLLSVPFPFLSFYSFTSSSPPFLLLLSLAKLTQHIPAERHPREGTDRIA
jgi:hypothetical protein